MTVDSGSMGMGGSSAGGEGQASGGGTATADTASNTLGEGTSQVGTESTAGGTPGEGAGGTAFAPSYKYKVLKEEKELPEWVRGAITSSDIEKQVRDVWERADGLDHVKSHRDQLVQENEQMRQEWFPVVQSAQEVVSHLQRGDLDSFFESLNISENDIFKYALQRLQLRENPQALQTHDQVRQLQLQNMQLQQQLGSYNENYTAMSVQQRTLELDGCLSRADILPAAQAFDARVGKPGAFRDEVIKRGKMYAAMQQDVPVDQAVNEVLQLIGGHQAAPAATTTQHTQQSVQTQQRPATLPSVRGTGSSPVKRQNVRSTDQLRQLARSLA